jgi:hypothetical protein
MVSAKGSLAPHKSDALATVTPSAAMCIAASSEISNAGPGQLASFYISLS